VFNASHDPLYSLHGQERVSPGVDGYLLASPLLGQRRDPSRHAAAGAAPGGTLPGLPVLSSMRSGATVGRRQGDQGRPEPVTVRDAKGALESYEPVRGLTAEALNSTAIMFPFR
jgi:hypothetical protein